jgi:hypothetical protein
MKNKLFSIVCTYQEELVLAQMLKHSSIYCFTILSTLFSIVSQAEAAYVFGPPYGFGFEPTDDFTGVAIIDANTDGNTWGISSVSPQSGLQHALYEGTLASTPDDWLMSIAFEFESSRTYRAGFYYSVEDAANPLELELFLGTAQAPAAMTRSLLDLGSITNTSYQLAELEFTVNSTDDYFFGLQVTGAANSGKLFVDANSVELEHRYSSHLP